MRPGRAIVILLLACMAALVMHAGANMAASASTEADLEAAISLYRTDGAEKALPEFERLRVSFSENDSRYNELRAQRYTGESYWQLGDYEQSRVHLELALAGMRQLGQRLAEGRILNVLGLLEWDLGNYDQAIKNFGQASRIGDELGDKRLAGSSMNNLSLVYDELGDYSTSLKQYAQALELYSGADFPRGEGDTLGNIGGVNLLLGRYSTALDYYQRALAISERLESKPSMSLDHGNMALCLAGLGQMDEALRHFELALELARETGMRKEEALWMRGKGNALIHKGQYDLGLENHRAALRTYEEMGARGLLLDALHDMGGLHLMLGDAVSAEQYFQRGMQLALELGQAQAITVNLLALGDIKFRHGHYAEADTLYRQSLQRATTADELSYQAESLLRLARSHLEQGKFDDADAEARRALTIAGQTGASPVATQAWFIIAEQARRQDQAVAALESFDSAQAVSGMDTDADLLWQIHYGRARALVQTGDKQHAVTELQAAVRIIESVRDRLREERFKAGYVQDKYKVYIDLVHLQLELGLTRDAFSTAERLRARSFLNQLESGGAVTMNPDDQRNEFALRERIRHLQSALQDEQDLPPPDRRDKAVAVFSTELLAAEREYQAFLDDINSRSATGKTTRIPSLSDVQSRLQHDEALLEYVVGNDNIVIFVMKPGSLSALTSDLDLPNLKSKVTLVRELIQQPSNDRWWEPAASLSDSLIRPIEQQGLLDDVRHIYLVPHDILNYLPFALLPTGRGEAGGLVMEQFSLSYLPAAATLVRDDPPGRQATSLLALAPANSRLRFALEEARSISDVYRPNSTLLSGQEATESRFKAQAKGYAILHFSTHGYFNVKNPLLSGLELEPDTLNDGFLEVHEILNLSLNAELVTLSACETGMSSGYFNQLPAGDEFVGLTRAFLLAGSRSVLATLWEVDDRSTVKIMEGFYHHLGRSGSAGDEAESLVQVQRELRKSKQYRHPFYWAPFVLVGQQERAASAHG